MAGQRFLQPFASAAPPLGDPPFSGASLTQARFAVRMAAPARTYWLEGAVIGAVGIGLGAALLGHAQCANTDVPHNCTAPTLVTAALGGAVGFGVGALVGGQFRKRAPR